jgi:subtilisin family serine protease
MPWHLDRIGMFQNGIRKVRETGRGVSVAMLDTGVCPFHAEFNRDTVWTAWKIEPNGSVIPTDPLSPESFRSKRNEDHGTAIGALICGKTIGVAPAARLISVILPRYESKFVPRLSTLANILITALEHFRDHPDFDVLNLSLAIPHHTFPENLLAQCRAILQMLNGWGIVTVAAIGNFDPQNGLTSPAIPGRLPETISVGAVDRGNLPWLFSLAGVCTIEAGRVLPDLMAPGSDIKTCRYEGDDRASGTSLSCAIVSGICAIIRERNPSAGFADCRSALLESCTRMNHVVQIP